MFFFFFFFKQKTAYEMRISDWSSDVCSSDLLPCAVDATTGKDQGDDAVATNVRINGQRLWDSLMEMAKIGATEKGGNCRLALTDLDRQARDLFVRWCEEAGCSVTVDKIGNIFARRPGKDPALPPIMTGSHLDTQPTGGKRSEEHTSELQSLMR